APDAVGEELVLRFGRPVGMPARMVRMRAEHFLQEHQVGGDLADGFAQRGQHEAATRGAEAHVGIQREDVEGRHAARVCRRWPARSVTGALAVAAARTATAGTAATGTRAVGTRAIRARTTGARTRAVAAGLCRARAIAVRIEGARIGVVGREARRVAGMTVGMRGATLAATRTTGVVARTAGTGAGPAGTARTTGLAAMRLARTARAIGIAMAAGAGIYAVGHVPGAERCGVFMPMARRAAAGLAASRVLPRLARALGLERLVDLLGRCLAADGQAAVRLLAATAATILAHVVEAAQLAALVGGVVAADVALGAMAAHVHGRLGRLALADHRLQRQCRRRAVLQAEFLAQRLDTLGGQLLRMPAQQRLRQFDAAVAHALEAADLATLRFPQAA